MDNCKEGRYFISTESFSGHVRSTYTMGPVASVDITTCQDDLFEVLVTKKDEGVYTWKSDSIFMAGHIMYGISISRDGKYLFAQKFSGGLDCLDLSTGKLIWKLKTRADIACIYVGEKHICCSKSHNALILIDIASGAILQEYRTPFFNLFDILDNTHIFVHSHAAYWEILNANTLEQVEKIPDKVLRNDHQSLLLRQLYHCYNPDEQESEDDDIIEM